MSEVEEGVGQVRALVQSAPPPPSMPSTLFQILAPHPAYLSLHIRTLLPRTLRAVRSFLSPRSPQLLPACFRCAALSSTRFRWTLPDSNSASPPSASLKCCCTATFLSAMTLMLLRPTQSQAQEQSGRRGGEKSVMRRGRTGT